MGGSKVKDPGDFFEWLSGAIQCARALSYYRNGHNDIPMAAMEADVPCDDCAKCCELDMQRPLFEDEDQMYDSVTDSDGRTCLATDDEGRCIYLVDGECSIYDRRPLLCRAYDCRGHVASRMIEREISDIAAQWDHKWYQDGYRAFILQAIHLAALDAEREIPGANSIIASDRGLARFPEYLGQVIRAMEEAKAKAEAEAEEERPAIYLPPGVQH